MGGSLFIFPETNLHVVQAVRAAGEPRERALARIVETYWKPVYKHIRRKWRADPESAKDLTQGFFGELLHRELLARFVPGKSAFRTYLRLCVDGYVSNEHRAASRLKRGGGQPIHSLDFAAAEAELPASTSIDGDAQDFDREFVRELFAYAVESTRQALVAAGKAVQFTVFECYDLCRAETPPTYSQLAVSLDLPVTQVTNYLASVRRRVREAVLVRLREVTGSDEEFREEAWRLLAVRVP